MCKAIRDLMEDSRAEGMVAGRAEGMEAGRAEGREAAISEKTRGTVINMLKGKEPLDKICLYAECSAEYVEAIQAELFA